VQLVVRDASPADADTIVSFNERMAVETEGRHLDHATIVAGVRRLLGDGTRGRYWLAESGGAIVGQIMITLEWSDWRDGYFWWIQSVYVIPDMRGRGVFRALFDHVEALARAAGNACGLRLYVEKENTAALNTYEALGMHDAGYRMMEIGISPAAEGNETC
jgi:ribosomal protein S18 acetylase RimI-like enzyme